MAKRKRRISPHYTLDILKFILRCSFFIYVCILYIKNKIVGSPLIFGKEGQRPLVWIIAWCILLGEMILRFYPTVLSTIGSKKQLKSTFVPTKESTPKPSTPRWRVRLLATLWISANLAIGILYLARIIDAGILILLSLLYSIGDMVCLLIFCPFRSWFLGNRCCADCRIYNWDYPMMFTLFIFIPHLYTWSLLGLSLVLLTIWEISAKRHPERFAENTNAALSCKNCKDKPCRHARRIAKKYKMANKNNIGT